MRKGQTVSSPTVYKATHAGVDYFVTAEGADRQDWCRDSFSLERAVRERWWRPKAGDVVLDIGAAFGSYTLPALAHGATVVAVEPSKEYMFSLIQNVAINHGFSERFVCLPMVAGDAADSLIDFSEEMHSCVRPGGAKGKRLVIRVDDIAQAGARCDWIKIDVEGMEDGVLRGAAATLARNRPKVLVECHDGFVPGISSRVAGFMQGMGYSGMSERGVGVNDHWTIWTPK